MAVLILPVNMDQPRQTMQVTLDDVAYILTLDFNSASSSWAISIADADGVDLVRGERLTSDWPLFNRLRHLAIPPGLLMVVDSTGRKDPVTRAGLGDRWKLIYVPEADVAGLGA